MKLSSSRHRNGGKNDTVAAATILGKIYMKLTSEPTQTTQIYNPACQPSNVFIEATHHILECIGNLPHLWVLWKIMVCRKNVFTLIYVSISKYQMSIAINKTKAIQTPIHTELYDSNFFELYWNCIFMITQYSIVWRLMYFLELRQWQLMTVPGPPPPPTGVAGEMKHSSTIVLDLIFKLGTRWHLQKWIKNKALLQDTRWGLGTGKKTAQTNKHGGAKRERTRATIQTAVGYGDGDCAAVFNGGLRTADRAQAVRAERGERERSVDSECRADGKRRRSLPAPPAPANQLRSFPGPLLLRGRRCVTEPLGRNKNYPNRSRSRYLRFPTRLPAQLLPAIIPQTHQVFHHDRLSFLGHVKNINDI